jgi:hypothetical protein
MFAFRVPWALPLLLVLILGTPQLLFSTAVNNGLGFGTVSVSVWCFPNAPPAAPSFAAFAGPGFFSSAALGPAIPGCNPATTISGANNVLWNTTWGWVAGGGDSVAGDGEDLFPFLTPSSTLATGSLSVGGTVINDTTVEFKGSYSLSDPGVGIRISWFSEANPMIGGELLFKVGGASSDFDVMAVDPMGTADVELKTEVAALSLTPEPASIMLLLGGCGILFSRFCNRIH